MGKVILGGAAAYLGLMILRIAGVVDWSWLIVLLWPAALYIAIPLVGGVLDARKYTTTGELPNWWWRRLYAGKIDHVPERPLAAGEMPADAPQTREEEEREAHARAQADRRNREDRERRVGD
jgi:hypothetical protein